MNNIQTDVSDEALVSSIYANLFDKFRHLLKSFPEESFENDKFMLWLTPLRPPWFNGVLCFGPPKDDDRIFIKETIEKFRKEKIKFHMVDHTNFESFRLGTYLV